jgi:4'-phosphopantetheinyl transferase EntD
MLEELLPPGVYVEELFADEPDAFLYPAEAAAVSRAVAKRRGEFATVRACARRALARLGEPAVPILPGERGAPGWPATVVGSLTHCAGYRGAAVAPASAFASIGIDAEPNAPVPDGVLDVVAGPAELAAFPSTLDICWDRLLFSAKESVYKAWFPLARVFLDFREAEVVFDPAGTFTARILVPGPVAGFSGRFLARDGLVLTAIAVPATR